MRQLAMMSGISGPYLSQIENGLRTPSEAVLRNLATTLGMDPSDLIGGPASGDLQSARDATRAAIEADPNLTTAQRHTLLEVYAAMAGTATAESAGGASEDEPEQPTGT